MRETTMKRIQSGVLLLVAAGLLAACAEERAPINRVQPYALPKTFFIGEDFQNVNDDPEFWTQTTMVDVGYGAKQDGLFTSTYAQPLGRIKWQVTEDMLIGRAAYERVEGSDGKGEVTGLQTQNGTIAVAFAITSHFDIVNAYNSTTGEKLNVVEENSYDRPWYEREYIRVDFSKSLQTDNYDFDTLSMIGVYGSITYEPLSYYVADPYDEEAPFFDFEESYFDITTKVFAKPGLIDLSQFGWGIDQFPACYLDLDFMGGTAPTGNCNPVEITLRQSFRRVVDHDVEPMNMDGWRFQAFGAFAFAERRGYDRMYGMTDDQYYRFKSTFPIYELNYYYENPEEKTGFVECYTPDKTPAGASPHRDLIGGGSDGESPDGTEDECQAVKTATGFSGSKCNEFTQKCTLPYRARKPQAMAWYYTNGSDKRFYEPSAYAVQQWDAALRSAVATAAYAECMAEELAGTTNADAIADAKEWCARGVDTDEDGSPDGWMPYFGQQDSNDDLLFLSQEMDDCRSARTHSDDITSEVGSDDREAACAAEIKTQGEAIEAEAGVISQAIAPEMIVMCHSPVQADDHALCAPEEERLPEGLSAWDCAEARAAGDQGMLDTCLAARNVRLGDLRYHVVNVIEAPQTPSPWGIMTSAIDPTNGETIASCTNIWSFVNDFWAQRVVDWMRYAAGEITSEEVTEGQNIKEWSQAALAASKGGVFPKMTRVERDKRVAEATGTRYTGASKADAVKPLKATAQIDRFFKELTQDFTGVMASSEVAGENAARYRTRMSTVAGTQLESELMNTMMQQLHGVEGVTLTDGLLDRVSPLRGGNPAFQREIKRLKQNALGERGMCEMEMADTPVSIVGLSKILQDKFGAFNAADSANAQFDRAKRMTAYIAKWAHASVVVHEMGHSIGHRHNFVSSSDAWNYRPQYWALRTNANTLDMTSDVPCNDLSADGEDCVGPRYFDPITENEADNLIWMWSFSSIMDYAGETTQDFQTLGAWDWAATRSMYGDAVAVYPLEYFKYDAAHSAATQYATYRRQMVYEKLDNFGGIIGFNYTLPDNRSVSYANLNNMLNLIPECETIDPELYKPSRWNDAEDGEWSPLLDGFIVSVDGAPTRCRQQKVDYARWTDLGIPADANIASYMRSIGGDGTIGYVTDKFTRARVPYGFASDNWADIGNASVYRHDNGADTYEIFNFLASQQELFSIFDNYRRGLSTFTLTGATSRIMDRYIAKMRDGAKGLAMQKNFLQIIGMASGEGVGGEALWDYAAKNWYYENMISSTMVFDHLVRNAQRPAPGPHGIPTSPVYADTIYPDDGDFSPCMALWVGQTSCDPAGTVPNGAYATTATANGFQQLSAGGKVVENQLSDYNGDYDSGYTITAGSYYDKIYMAMMMTESVDNFISESRGDFIDKRYRSVSLTDLFPDGYRRWIGNMLTNDAYLKGPRVEVDGSGVPLQDADGFWSGGIGWTKWWGDEVESCFPGDGTNICTAYVGGAAVDIGNAPANVMPVDPEFAWEVQKFLIAETYLYLPENQKAWWRDQMGMFSAPSMNADTLLDQLILFKNPTGWIYAAKRFGKEEIFGRTVEKGVSARVLEYANSLLAKAYETTPVDYDGDGTTDWYEPVLYDGAPAVLFDESTFGAMSGTVGGYYPDDCSETDNSGCTCTMNRYCVELEDYISVLDYMAAWSGTADFDPTDESNEMIGIW